MHFFRRGFGNPNSYESPSSNKTMRPRTTLCLLLSLIGAALSFACAAKQKETSPAATTQVSPAQATGSPLKVQASSATPTLSEVTAAVRRVYLDTVEIDASRNQPFIVGDFNGDRSQDLAVVAKPAKGALTKLNSEYANWIVEDPRKIRLPDPENAVQVLPQPPAREMIRNDDTLLLVLHGYHEEGWHHPYARQTFLLKNAVGENMHVETWNEVSKATGRGKGLVAQAGDVITERLAGQDGFLYWTSGKYVWREYH